MNDTLLIFAVIPLTFGLIGFVFSLVFGPDIMHRYNERRASQRRFLKLAEAVERVEPIESPNRYEPASSSKERELVHS
jgi:hypothetical protein